MMGIVPAMILSIIIKGVAAILELSTQLFISNNMGVSKFGIYTFFVSVIECSYFLLLSGSIKINTYYLSTKEWTIRHFKKEYLGFYVVPIVLISFFLSLVSGNYYACVACIVVFIYYNALDRSSIFFARGQQLQALLGEYLVGRVMMLISVVICFHLHILTTFILLCLFGVQYLSVYLWFAVFSKNIKNGSKNIKVSINKLYEFQQSDIASSLITYTPAILQYVLGGAFATGFIGVISVVRKFVYFISGPTAKVFLPEFSKLYKEGKINLLQKTYIMIVKIQMVFIGVIGMAVIGFPKLLLSIFNKKLIPYSTLFLLAGICLLFIASLGPVLGILQMTGNEKKGTRNQWISIVIMIIFWFAFKKYDYFIVYGLCVQAVLEGSLEYLTICRWMHRFIVSPLQFVKLWLPIILIAIIINYLHMSMSLIMMFVSLIIVGSISVISAMNDNLVRQSFGSFISRIKK